MSAGFDEEEKTRVILRRLHVSSRPYVMRISWCKDLTDATTIMHHASCFALKIGENLFGVTAAHVARQFIEDKKRHGQMHLLLDEEAVDFLLIDISDKADVVTFRIDHQLLERAHKKYFSYRIGDWPPAPPEQGKGIVLTGYPKERQTIKSAREVDVVQVSNCLVVDDIHYGNMTIKVKAKHLRSIDAEPIPPFSEDVGGYSGAPVLTVSSDLGQLFRLGGVLYEGAARSDEEGEYLEFKAEPISRIRPDGRLNQNHLW